MIHTKLKWQALFALLLVTACTKIDSTKLGSELIPVVDNIKTFDTTLAVVANNYIGNEEYSLNAGNLHMVGGITQDPVFGESKATMFFEMKPASFPNTFVHKDSLQGSKVGFDSAVMILEYVTYYGDTINPLSLKLYQLASNIQRDTALAPTYTLNATGLAPNRSILWGSAMAQVNKFKDSIAIKKGDSTTGKVVNQLRIRLDNNLARTLFLADSTVYGSDSAFRTHYPGFALEADGQSKTLLYFTLGGATKIEFFYHANPLSPKQDTNSSTLSFTALSGHAVKFENNRSGAEISSHLVPDPINGKDNIYIQSSPGSYARISIPGLQSFKQVNRIIHRAELRFTQVENAQTQLTPPQALYLDVIDTTADAVYKGIPYDLNPFSQYYCYPATGIDFNYFGGITKTEKVNLKDVAVYRFNISRYIQAVLTRNEPIYDFRLSAPFYMIYKNCANATGTTPQQVFPFSASASATSTSIINPPGKGRVKLAGGSPAVDQSVRMQLRIIYSTL